MCVQHLLREKWCPMRKERLAYKLVDSGNMSLNYIKQLRLKDTLHWTPLFSKEKLHTHEYDIPLDRVGHW